MKEIRAMYANTTDPIGWSANMCKSPRDKSILVLAADREAVFSRPQEFVEHHGLGKMEIVLGQEYPFSVRDK